MQSNNNANGIMMNRGGSLGTVAVRSMFVMVGAHS
jgi:hypothetical protein